MLVVDPMKRINISDIRQHQWFQACLPRYLAVPPPDTMQQAKKVSASKSDCVRRLLAVLYDAQSLCVQCVCGYICTSHTDVYLSLSGSSTLLKRELILTLRLVAVVTLRTAYQTH